MQTENEHPLSSALYIHSIATLACVLIFNSISGYAPLPASVKDAGHLITFYFFGLFLIEILATLKPELTLNKRCLYSFLLVVCVGIGVELVQPFVGRQFSIQDWLMDIAGGFLAILFAQSKSSINKKAFVTTVMLISFLVLPGYQIYLKYLQLNLLPKLYTFDANWQKNFISTNPDSRYYFENNLTNSAFLKSTLVGTAYPGITFKNFFPDWSGFNKLTIEAILDEPTPIRFYLRINDVTHNNEFNDRYNTNIELQPGLNRTTIDLNDLRNAPNQRLLDTQNIQQIILFTDNKTQPVQLSVLQITLS